MDIDLKGFKANCGNSLMGDLAIHNGRRMTESETRMAVNWGIKNGIETASMIRIDFGDSCAYVCGEQAQTVMDCVKGKYVVAEDRVFTTMDILHILPGKVKDYWGHWGELLDIKLTTLSGWCVSYGSTWYTDCDSLKNLLCKALIWCLDKKQVSRQWLKQR